MKKINYKRFFATLSATLLLSSAVVAQNDVMMQAFYWNLPVNSAAKNGYWWDTLRINKLTELRNAGVTALWLPSPCKGNCGVEDMGYGIYDHYDLGAYNQKGSTETRFGSKSELTNLISACHNTALGARVDVYADAVLNHTYGEWGLNEESNPAVKAYVFGEAHNGANTAYQTSDIKWVIPNATAGDYYIQIKGYNQPWSGAVTDRGYNLNINWTNATETDPNTWETEPNNGSGQTNNYPGSGVTIRAHANYQGDIDEYKVTLTGTANIVIKLTTMKETGSGSTWQWIWGEQTYGFYPVAIWKNGTNLATTTLEARTPTKSTYPTHTGTGEANYQWGYADYHPVDANDWLGNGGFEDELVPNTRWFGNDYNTYSTTVQSRLNAWGSWMVNTIGFDGYRLDFVRGFQVDFVSNWINALPKNGTAQRYIVGEYWTSQNYRLKNWVNDNAAKGSTVSVFDFPLKSSLTSMCNGSGSNYDMRWLNHAGVIRDANGNSIASANVSTFVDNHDTGKEHDKWVGKDWKLGYAYILTHEGRPCLFYPHFYSITQEDNSNASITTTASASLRNDLKKLMFIRKTYLGGGLTVLSDVGNPYPSADAYNVYVARRAGNGTKSGAIVVLNNNDSQTKGLWVTTNPTGWSNWAGLWLKNALNPTERVQVQADGRVYVQATARSYAVYVLESEYVAYTAPAIKGLLIPNSSEVNNSETQNTVKVWPNPITDNAKIDINLSTKQNVTVEVYSTSSQLVANVFAGELNEGTNTITWNSASVKAGIYIIKVKTHEAILSTKVVVK